MNATPPARLSVAITSEFHDCGVSRDEWNQLALRLGGDIYVSYDWCEIWWRHYGKDRVLRLFVFRDRDTLVGIAPFFIESVRLGPAKVRIAKRVGADFALELFSLPVEEGHATAAYAEIAQALIEREKCDAVWFGLMPGDDKTLPALRAASQSVSAIATIARDAPGSPHIFFRLPATFEAYIASLDKRQRQNYRRDVNLLKRSFTTSSVTLKSPEEATAAFQAFIKLHHEQWSAEGKLGHFGDWPGSASFNDDLVGRLSRLDQFRIMNMAADGNIVSSQYAFVFGNRCCWRLPARGSSKDLSRFGLGRLGLMQLIEAMIAEGVQYIEAGLGHYDYKLQLGGVELQSRSFLLASTRMGNRTRIGLFLALSDWTHFLYYRLWFLKLAPRISLLKRPLWRKWIRSRL
jgi:CelD/BcsL family acetyltransferase involved in cellulose biosynthesis